MDVIDLLLVEHRHIGRVLDRLEDECRGVREGEILKPRLFHRVSFFLSEHVDGCHQAKERALFDALAPSGLLIAPAPVRKLVKEHEVTSEHGVRIGQLAERFDRGLGDVEELLSATMAYVRHFRDHAREEETVVFPLARRLLMPPVKELLRSRIARIEATQLPMADAATAIERSFRSERGLYALKAP